jgi:hypothetical protein
MRNEGSHVRTVASLIDQGPVELDKAVQIIVAACRAYARPSELEMLSPEQVLVAANGDVSLGPPPVSLCQRVIRRLQMARLWFQHLSLRARNGPRIIVVRNTIAWERMHVRSFGAMLWAITAGRALPAREHLHDRAVPPHPRVPPALEAIVREALAPDGRYRTRDELATALEAYRSTLPQR